MSSTSVFKALQELFPQVDSRILKAVSIEHNKDTAAAVEFILCEVLPSIGNPTKAQGSHIVTSGEQSQLLENQEAVLEGKSLSQSRFVASKHCDESNLTSKVTDDSLTCLVEETPNHIDAQLESVSDLVEETLNHIDVQEESVAEANLSTFVGSKLGNGPRSKVSQPSSDHFTWKLKELASLAYLNPHEGYNPFQECVDGHKKNVSLGEGQVLQAASTSMIHDDNVFSETNDVSQATILDLNEPVAYNSTFCGGSDSFHAKSCSNAKSNGIENAPPTFQLDSSCVFEESQKLVEDVSGLQVSSLSQSKELDARGSLETVSDQMVYDTKLADFEDESFSTTVGTQSGQICKMDLLEDAISEAKHNKKTLFSSMESVINMMREVEHLEEAAEQAKEEAVKGGEDILSKVEDIKRMLLHAKEANDMHAGEVYGEKAILATEARELQSRLLNLSDERDRSLTILDEMLQVLEARLLAAKEIRKEAEQNKHEKEDSARKALMDQELIMEKVVKESKRLQSEAEENSKVMTGIEMLREFLMDRGQIVDILQGEIAVICQDVKMLKENFDDQVPFSKSLSSSQTSCILASSGSSGKSLASNLVPEQLESSENSPKTPSVPVDDVSPNSASEVCEGWDMFEDEEEIYASQH
ncbi:hypothetical protein IFM89_009122 [Coptis chinensis]|uniref:CUE domain-containing protein n=1 Tax=Coptis chinensis TaxID=261450 RepID=A0A835HTV7_9MAGN|nr:hypothetical protein IFM89_009122 [Coptis chinensis]